jgi:hypothetical protein
MRQRKVQKDRDDTYGIAPEEEKKVEPPPRLRVRTTEVEMKQFTPPVIKKDEEVKRRGETTRTRRIERCKDRCTEPGRCKDEAQLYPTLMKENK